jgi:hypothetical protein
VVCTSIVVRQEAQLDAQRKCTRVAERLLALEFRALLLFPSVPCRSVQKWLIDTSSSGGARWRLIAPLLPVYLLMPCLMFLCSLHRSV